MKKTRRKSIRLPSHIIPRKYKIRLQPDLEGFTFHGEEVIELELARTSKKITLHSKNLEIEGAEFIRNQEETWPAKITYDEDAETITLAFPRSIQKGSGQLKLVFTGILNDKMKGFYRSKYEADGQEKYLATTQFEATDARRAFPCFDEPDKKAVFEVSFLIPQSLCAISNTVETSVREHEGGLKLVEFAPTPLMSTYLLAFIIGEFEYIQKKSKEGIFIRVFTTWGKKVQAEFALDVASKIISFYNDYFGIPYPLPTLDLIAVPDFAFGAMENWGAVTYRESVLLIDQEHSSARDKQWVALVIAHELAHMWFGDLVTMKWWTHLWLNEGFASYIEYLAVDHLFPEWDIWTQFVGLEQNVALKLDSLLNTHPIEVEVLHPNEINEIFDKVSYSKGASVIRMLAEYLGPKVFQRGLRHYLKKHKYSNAETRDLWVALEETSGKPVRRIMHSWTSKAGHPIVTVKKQEKKLNLAQERFFSSSISKSKLKDRTIWSIPILVGKKRYLMSGREMKIPLPKTSQDKINTSCASFIRVNYDHYDSPQKLPTLDRLGIIRDDFDLSEAGFKSLDEALFLARNYQGEEDYTVWLTLSLSLMQVANLIFSESFYPKFKNFGRKVFEKIARRVGWNKKPREKHTDTLLRALALYNFGTYGDGNTIAKAQGLFSSALRGENIDPDLRGVVYSLVAENGGKAEHDRFVKMYKAASLQQEKEKIAKALASFRQEDILAKTLRFALSQDVRLQDTIHVLVAVWNNPYGRDLTWEFIQENWRQIHRRLSGSHLLSRLLQSGANFTTEVAAKEIDEFFKKNPVPEAQRTLLQVKEQIRSNAAWLSRDKKRIKKFLTDF